MIWDVVDGETRLCHTDHVQFFTLSPVGAFLWNDCDNTTIEALVELVQKAYPRENQARLAADVECFVSSLEAADLLEVREESIKLRNTHRGTDNVRSDNTAVR